MTKGDNLIDRRRRVVCPGVGQLSALTAASAKGAMLTDVDGREYIDFAGGIGVMNVGHCDEDVVDAVRTQVGLLMHTCFHVATYEPYVALCEQLVRLIPHGPDTKAVLVNSGAEAVENAIKIARQATGRSAVICYTGAFHGRTLLAGTMTSKINYKLGCGPYAPEIYRLPYPVVHPLSGVSEAEVVDREIHRLRAAFHDTVAPTDVAAIILELVQGEGGFCVAPKRYVQALREMCDEHGIVLIFDEVQTGFCRTARWAASEHYGVTPDLSTWAKSLGGGLPIAGVLGKAEVMDRVTPGTLGGTYGGNPVACAGAIATIRKMESINLNAKAAHVGDVVRHRLMLLAEKVPQVTDVRGIGAMIALELSENGDIRCPAGKLVKAVVNTCREKGLVLVSAGIDGNVIRLLSPLVISDDLLDRGLGILENAVLEHTHTLVNQMH